MIKKTLSVDPKSSSRRKRFSSMTTTFRMRQIPLNHILSQSESQNCPFCKKLKESQASSFGLMINKALYQKYSSSQNYYYAKDVNDILENDSTPAVVFFRDLQVYIEDDDYLKRYLFLRIINHRLYNATELKNKFLSLTEYYKFHIDIPRLYMRNICRTIYYFHDKKRRIEYVKIKQNLGLQDELSHDKSKPKDQTNHLLNNVLAPLQLEYSMNQKPQESKQMSKQPVTKQKFEASISILSIIQNIPKLDNMKNTLYMESFEDSKIDQQLKEMSRLFQEKVPQFKPKIKIQAKSKPRLLLLKSIPQTVIYSLIQQQKKQVNSFKKNSQQTIKPFIKSIDIEVALKKNLKSPQQSQRSSILTSKLSQEKMEIKIQSDKKQNFQNKVYLPVRKPQINDKARRTNSNYQSYDTHSNQKHSMKLNFSQFNQNQHLQLGQLGRVISQRELLKPNEIQQLIRIAQTSYQTSRVKAIPKLTPLTKHLRTRSTDQLIQQNELSPTNNVYVGGCHKKVPSMYTFDQNNLVSVFMDELRNSLKVPALKQQASINSMTALSILNQRSQNSIPLGKSGVIDFGRKNIK